jgi:uncharacterized protein (DUF849 family)
LVQRGGHIRVGLEDARAAGGEPASVSDMRALLAAI